MKRVIKEAIIVLGIILFIPHLLIYLLQIGG